MKLQANKNNRNLIFFFWFKIFLRFPFVLHWIYENCLVWFYGKSKKKESNLNSVSVIIPTLNEEERIKACISSVTGSRYHQEIIVVDGGSSDRTRIIAENLGAKVICHDLAIEKGGGRGGQIRKGIDSASGDVVVILHADTILPAPEIHRIMKTLNKHREVVGGSVGCRFDSPGILLRIIEYANDFRAAFMKISFGDQVQFFRREPVVKHDLFPGIPLMEDVEFSIRLNRLGRQKYLFGEVINSPRRWEKSGLGNAFFIIKQVFSYLISRLWSDPDTVAIYKKYYKDAGK